MPGNRLRGATCRLFLSYLWLSISLSACSGEDDPALARAIERALVGELGGRAPGGSEGLARVAP
ncbi:MAG: hypothetical protein OXT09_11045, partial [Myxococcales bacterium]|nr:hypothetical protein [Myxococcales bacterium]